MKIGIVGSGQVGGTLGAVWVRAGHEVMFSSREIEHDKALAAKLGANARAGTPREAAAFGEVVTWARDKGAGLASAELHGPGPRAARRVGMPIAGDDAEAIALASALIPRRRLRAGCDRRAHDGEIPDARNAARR